jgi:MFS family permease
MQIINKILSDIGMKSYQWQLFFVCGMGWIADNMWLQGASAVLPKVQQEFGLSNQLAGFMITITMLGMMVGGTLWGYLGDRIGRKPAFTLTLLIAFVFGSLSALSTSFVVLCLMLFAMGSGVGGNLPVDGALFLEFMPPEKRGLLTLLSIFWPVGSLIASILAWVLIPNFDNGWRYVFISLGLITLIMVTSRTILFSFYESPKFLASCGRYEAAYQVLQDLADKNDVELNVDLQEFKDSFQNDEAEKEPISCEVALNDLSPQSESSETQGLIPQNASSSLAWFQNFIDELQLEPLRILFSPEYRLTTILLW